MSLPVCSWPRADRSPCGQPSRYAFRLLNWPPHRKAAVCVEHAEPARMHHAVATIWDPAHLTAPPLDHGR